MTNQQGKRQVSHHYLNNGAGNWEEEQNMPLQLCSASLQSLGRLVGENEREFTGPKILLWWFEREWTP